MRIFKRLIRKIIIKTDRYIRRKNYDPVRQSGTFYEKRYLPAEVSLLRAGNFTLFSYFSKPLIRELKNQIDLNLDEDQKKDKAYITYIEKEFIKSYLFNRMHQTAYRRCS